MDIMSTSTVSSTRSTNCVISFENPDTKEVQTITGKNAFITKMRMEQDNNLDGVCIGAFTPENTKIPIVPNGITTITFELKILDKEMVYDFFVGNSELNIRNKKVEDCTIQELLFAVRNKIK